MNIIELLVKAANNNHGRTLQPEQVRETVTYISALNNELQAVNGRLDALTKLMLVALSRLGGKITVQAHEFDEAAGDGFSVHWDEEGDTIEVKLDNLGVPEVQVEDNPADGESDGDSTPVSEVSEAGAPSEDGDTEEGA